MPFMHPMLFAGGAAAASVPIIIHLLNRRRFKVLDWAAMRFLLESVRKNRRRILIEELILLALRCLAVFLLAVAVGRFLGCAPTQVLPVGTSAQMTHVFILDDSVSMGQKVADTTAFSKAASDLAGMIEAIPSTDEVAVLLTSRPKRSEALCPLKNLTDPEVLSGRLKSLKPSDTTAMLNRAVRTAGEILNETGTEKRLYVLSDFRSSDYGVEGNIQDMSREFKILADTKAEIILMNYGAAPSVNLTAVDIRMLDKLAVASVPVRMEFRVRNNGPKRAEDVSVSFVVRSDDGEEVKLPVRTIRSIDPGQTESVQIAYTFPDAGPAVIEAQLSADNLAGDNTASLALDIRKARRVLIVDGEHDVSDPINSESIFLTVALDPSGDGRDGNKCDVVPADRVAEVNFDRYDAVILANVGRFPMTVNPDGSSGYAQMESLSRYVRGGGGLVIFTGDRVNPDFYNGPFYDSGKGLCPLRIAAPVGDANKKQKYVRLLRQSISSESVMNSFQGRRSPFTQLVRFYVFTPVDQSASPVASSDVGPVRVLARFDNTDSSPQQSPAIVARSYGSGSVMMIFTSADTEWTDWPKDRFTWLSFVNDMVEYISRQAGRDFTATVGRRIDYTVPTDIKAARVMLKTPAFPAEDVIALEGRRVGGQRVISYENPRHKGIYQLKLNVADEERSVLFARNTNPREGRLDRINEQQIRSALGVEFTYHDRLKTTPADAATAAEGSEYWKAALAAMLIILAAEVFLGQRFGHYR